MSREHNSTTPDKTTLGSSSSTLELVCKYRISSCSKEMIRLYNNVLIANKLNVFFPRIIIQVFEVQENHNKTLKKNKLL